MNPHQKNKVDISVSPHSLPYTQKAKTYPLQSLSADEQRLFRLYGKLPNKKDLLQNKLKVCQILPSLPLPPLSFLPSTCPATPH
jgi:cAMP-regulated phosphoprotein/endosulfine conserved region